MATYPLIVDNDPTIRAAVWHANVNPEIESPWNSGNEVLSGDWVFAEADYLATSILLGGV